MCYTTSEFCAALQFVFASWQLAFWKIFRKEMVPMKKLLSIALALVLCLALCVPAFAATPDLGSFTDKIEEIKASLGDFDTADLDSIKDALSGSGIDLSEIAGLLGGGDFDLGAIKDQVDISAVKDALAKLGIDTSMLGDVDILGMLAGLVGGSGSAATPSDPNKTDNANTNGGSNGAADDVEIPDTGNTGIAAIAALTMAAAAVVVLAKKKH